jgi:hypothetical protein
MKVKTSELQGATLDWAVAKCVDDGLADFTAAGWRFTPSTDWAQGGPIIEREGILLRPIRKEGHQMNGQWLAMYDETNTGTMVQWVKRKDFPGHYHTGPTPLIAAMRCYVASKLGDEVDVPEELL